MENANGIGISYGVMSDKLSKQIKDQGFDFDKGKIDVFQKESAWKYSTTSAHRGTYFHSEATPHNNYSTSVG